MLGRGVKESCRDQGPETNEASRLLEPHTTLLKSASQPNGNVTAPTMTFKLIQLDKYRLPDHPQAALQLDRSPLAIVDCEGFTEDTDASELTAAVGIATILYNWCPDALAAFLDLDAWFSLTWSLSIQQGEDDETNIEIGRVGNQITFGSLDKDGENWTLMLTYNIVMDGPERCTWIPNVKESLENDDDVTNPIEIDNLGRKLVGELLHQKRWNTGRKLRHKLFAEYAPMDIWGDGIPMNPHWLYAALDLTRCTTCDSRATEEAPLQRCGRCGTAAYCSDICQRRDWAVHKHVCSLSLEDRGQMLAITEKGGLIMWDTEKTFATKGSCEVSKNPNFVKPQLKRSRHLSDTESTGSDKDDRFSS